VGRFGIHVLLRISVAGALACAFALVMTSGALGQTINGCQIQPGANCPDAKLANANLANANLAGSNLPGPTSRTRT
jgi:uncharacterized protein YjbI with pentapeptide repeats